MFTVCGGRLKSWGGIGVDQLSMRERERESEVKSVCYWTTTLLVLILFWLKIYCKIEMETIYCLKTHSWSYWGLICRCLSKKI